MTEIDMSPEAVAQHLAEAEIAHTLSSPLYTEMSGVSTRVGWHRRNDTLMRALSVRVVELKGKVADRILAAWQMQGQRDAAITETRILRDSVNDLCARLEAARAEVARLQEVLHLIAERDVRVIRAGDPELGPISETGRLGKIALAALAEKEPQP